MNKVYTESVVTLNGTAAEQTMQALGTSADALRKKMLEATRLGDTKSAEAYRKQLDAVNKSMTAIRKETKDYSDLMRNLNGASINTLAKAYKGLNNQLKNLVPGTAEFIKKSEQLKQVKQRLDEVTQSTRRQNDVLSQLKGVLPKIGLAAFFTSAAAAAKQFASDAIQQTQTVGDRWKVFTAGLQSAYGSFVADLSSGTGWKDLINNMVTSFEVGKQVAAILDEIFERQNSLSIQEAEYSIQIEQQKQIMKDTTRTDQERIDAAEQIIRLEKELATLRKDIAQDEYQANKLALQTRTKLSDQELESLIAQYNANRDIITQATEYNDKIDEQRAKIKALHRQYDMSPLMAQGDVMKQILAAEQELAHLEQSGDAELRKWADLVRNYNLGNDNLVEAYVKSRLKMSQADADFYRDTARAATTMASLRKDMSDEETRTLQKAYQTAVSTEDKRYAAELLSLKQSLADKSISQTEYDLRTELEQRQHLEKLLEIQKKYQQDTVKIQTELLELSQSQREEVEDIMYEGVTAVSGGIAEILSSTDSEMDAWMAEVEASMAEHINHLLELDDKARELREAMNPAGAIKARMTADMLAVQEMYDNGLLNEQEFQEAKLQILRDYGQKSREIELAGLRESLQNTQSYLEQSASAVSAMHNASLAQMEARMAAEIAAAGDSAEQRAAIEQKYADQKLAIEKKYADVDMVINIAKTVAAGALAAVQALAQLGPVAGAAAAAVIGVTTAAEVATIVAQRNAIKNATSGGGSSSDKVVSRTVTGYSEGGYTSHAASDYTEVGVVHANEWVAPAAMVRANPITFARLEAARVSGVHAGSTVQGFADGGYTSEAPAGTQADAGGTDVIRRLADILEQLEKDGIKAYVITSELNRQQEIASQLTKITGRK